MNETLDNNWVSYIYEEVKEELGIDPQEQLGSKERLDGIIERAGRG